MTILVACLSLGKGTWGSVTQLIHSYAWEKVYLVTNMFGKDTFQQKNVTFVVIDPDTDEITIRDTLIAYFRDTLSSDVAVNFTSGTGKEHMALLAALLRLGIGIRLVVPGPQKSLIEV